MNQTTAIWSTRNGSINTSVHLKVGSERFPFMLFFIPSFHICSSSNRTIQAFNSGSLSPTMWLISESTVVAVL